MKINGVEIHHEEEGEGRETIVFAHGLLFSGRMFESQVRALKDRHRCVTFDFRGQGRSEVTASGYDMDSLTEDAAGLIEALGCAPCHFVGLSMGGFVGMRLAARRPGLLRSLVLLETSADPEAKENVGSYRRLNFVARWLGVRPVAGRVMKILYGRKFLEDPARATLREEWRRRLLANDRIGITRAVTGVIDRAGVSEEIGRIAFPRSSSSATRTSRRPSPEPSASGPGSRARDSSSFRGQATARRSRSPRRSIGPSSNF